MANVFLNLPVPTGVGVGAAVDTSALGRTKTFTVQGSYSGSLIIEISNEGAAGPWAQAIAFSGSDSTGKKKIDIAARFMRVRRPVSLTESIGGAANVDVASNDNGGLFLDLPAGNPGASIDVSALGTFKTVVVQDLAPGLSSVVYVEISEDGIDWAQCFTFTQNGLKSKVVTARFMRARGSFANIDVGAINDAISQAADPDDEVAVSGADTNPAFLDTKLTAGANVSFVILNPGSDESLEISATGTPITDDPPVNVDKSAAQVGVSTEAARADHKHDIDTDTTDPNAVKVGNAAAEGTATELARADHIHSVAAGTPSTVRGPTNSSGASVLFNRSDHKHRLELEVSDVGGLVGARPEIRFLEGDATIDIAVADNGGGDRVDVSVEVGEIDAANIDTGVPITVRGPTNAEGVSTEISRADHDHRLELEVEDEGVLAGARPALNFIGAGVGAVDNPGLDRVDVTIPGDVEDGAVVKRSTYVATSTSTSSGSYVDGMSGASVTCPIDGDYLALFEGESENQSGSGVLEIGISVNSTVAVIAGSERESQGNASDMRPAITSVQLPGLTAGDLVRTLFRKPSGAGSVSLHRRHLILIKVQ